MNLKKLIGLLVAVVAFGVAGCQGEVKPRPPKPTAPKKSDKPGAAEPPAPAELWDVPTKAEPAKAVPPVVIVAGANGEVPAIVKRFEDRLAAKAAPAQPTVRLAGIRSKNPHPTKEQAIADALNVARTELMKQLDLLDPPVHTRPSLVTMRNSYVKGEIREILPTEEEKSIIRANNLNSNVRWVEIDFELSEDQVQKLRSAERVTDAFRVAALVFALVAALYGFLRLDQWTKGYLTLWLGLGAGAAVLVVGLVVLG